MNRLSFAVCGALLLGTFGCTPAMSPVAVNSQMTAARTVTVQGAVQVKAHNYKLATISEDYNPISFIPFPNHGETLSPYTAANIHHISVTLNGQPAGDVMPSGDGNVFYLTFRNLKAETTYNVELTAYAYDVYGHFNVISVPQGSATQFSTVTMGSLETSINTELYTQDVNFNMQLADQTFAGRSSGSITVEPGAVKNTEENETVGSPFPWDYYRFNAH